MKNIGFDWNDLKFFLAAARHQGLSGAAAALHTSPSTVSRHITALEERLKATLFLRQQSGYLLTDDGSALLQHVEQIELAMLAAERDGPGGSSRQDVSGPVRLATTEMLATHLVVPNLTRLRARYPHLQVELNISLSRANLSKREADLALRVVGPEPHQGMGDYIGIRSGRMDFRAYCAKGLLAPDRPDGQAKSWRDLDYVSWDESGSDLPMAKWLKTAFPNKAPALACNNMLAQHLAMRSGLGVGLLPSYVGDRDPGLERLDLAEPILTRDIWIVYHRDLKASRRVLAMRDFLEELLRDQLP